MLSIGGFFLKKKYTTKLRTGSEQKETCTRRNKSQLEEENEESKESEP